MFSLEGIAVAFYRDQVDGSPAFLLISHIPTSTSPVRKGQYIRCFFNLPDQRADFRSPWKQHALWSIHAGLGPFSMWVYIYNEGKHPSNFFLLLSPR